MRNARGAIVTGLILLCAVACANGNANGNAASSDVNSGDSNVVEVSDTVRSNTPRITVSESSDAESLLLTQADVRSISDFGEVVAEEIRDVPLFENPDPRGPCGGVVPQIPLQGSIGRAFSGSDVVVVELVGDASVEGRAYVEALRADRHDGCAGFESTTNTGDVQVVSDIAFVDIDAIAANGIAWTSRVDVGSGGAYAAVMAADVDDRLVFIQSHGVAPFDDGSFAGLVELAMNRTAGT